MNPVPVSKHQIWNDKPVYKIKFDTAETYHQFAQELQARCKEIDAEGKIRFDPAALQIDIHYFPRIARNLLMPLCELFPQPKGFEPDVLGTRFELSGNLANNRFQFIHRFMTVDYAREHEDAFEYRSKRWEDTCRQIERNGERPTWCTTNCNATYQDYRNLFETITNQSFLLGEESRR